MHLLFVLSLYASGRAQMVNKAFLPNTDYEPNVSWALGNESGTTITIIGNTPGGKPGGYLPADFYENIVMNKGNLIIVPRANFYSLLFNRGNGLADEKNSKFRQNGSMNKSHDEEISVVRKHLIAESSLLLNMYEGPGFYAPAWNKNMKNSGHNVQSLVYDAEVYPLPAHPPQKDSNMMAAVIVHSEPVQNSAANEQVAARPRFVADTPPEIPMNSGAGEVVTPHENAQQPMPIPAPVTQPKTEQERIAANKIEQPQKIMASTSDITKDKKQIMDFVESWRQAWVSQNTDDYISFYDKTFESGGKNLAQWRAHKEKLNKTYAYIAVTISNTNVNWTAEGATVSFRQEYRSDRYTATGAKTLFLVYNDLGWKIKREVSPRN